MEEWMTGGTTARVAFDKPIDRSVRSEAWTMSIASPSSSLTTRASSFALDVLVRKCRYSRRSR